MKKILLTALMLSVITACTKTEEFCEAERQFHLRFGKSKNTPFHLEEMVDTFYSVQLEDSFIVGNVDEIRYINDKFYLICKKEGRITCVDRNGRFLHTLKKKGHAKSEYVTMSDADGTFYACSECGEVHSGNYYVTPQQDNSEMP